MRVCVCEAKYIVFFVCFFPLLVLRRVFRKRIVGGWEGCSPAKNFSRNLINFAFLFIILLFEEDLYFMGKPRCFNVVSEGKIGKDENAEVEDTIHKLRIGPGKVLMIQHLNLVVKSIYPAFWSISTCYLCF